MFLVKLLILKELVHFDLRASRQILEGKGVAGKFFQNKDLDMVVFAIQRSCPCLSAEP
jgi:hypothetical protein